MFTFLRPSEELLRSILEQERAAPFSYSEVGASRESVPPSGFRFDRHRLTLGAGMRTFLAAKAALQKWDMFDRTWLRVFPDVPEIREGSVLAVVASHFGFYSINLCRIVYALDSEESVFGFAYGTLTEHAESGEERFTISWSPKDDSVFYEILAFSKPRAFLARAGYPVGRALQRQFAWGSLAAMRNAVNRGIHD